MYGHRLIDRWQKDREMAQYRGDQGKWGKGHNKGGSYGYRSNYAKGGDGKGWNGFKGWGKRGKGKGVPTYWFDTYRVEANQCRGNKLESVLFDKISK